jgi:hypothetical protein
MLYRVKFEIDVEADTAQEAAQITNDLMNDGNHRWSYDVTDSNGTVENVDLMEEEE